MLLFHKKQSSDIIFLMSALDTICRYISREYFSPYIIGSSAEWRRRKAYPEINRLRNQQLFINGVDATKIAKPSPKWIVYVLPSKLLWQQNYDKDPLSAKTTVRKITTLLDLATHTTRNVLCVNYRIKPSSFQDVIDDVDTGVKHLLEQDVKENDILFYAHSIGSVAALQLAKKYNTAAVIQNTFSKLEDLVEPFSKALVKDTYDSLCKRVTTQQDTSIRLKRKIQFLFIDLTLSLPHLALRISYFALSLLGNLCKFQFSKATSDLLEIGKTIVIDTAITISSLFIFLNINKVNQFNANCKSHYLKRSAVCETLSSPKFIWLAKKILQKSGWHADNTAAVLSMDQAKLFIVQLPNDKTMKGATLEDGLRKADSTIQIHNFETDAALDSHNEMASPVHTECPLYTDINDFIARN